jgi:hypothetical protein
MKPFFKVPVNSRSIGVAAGLVGLVILYVLFANFGGVVGGLVVGAAVGCAVSGAVGLYRFLFVVN